MADVKDWVNKRQNWEGIFMMDVALPPENHFDAMLSNGVTTSIIAAAGDDWEYEVPSDKVVFIRRSNIVIQDKGVAPAIFGGVGLLANGCLVRAYDTNGTTVLKNWTADFTIKKNSDFAFLAGSDTPMLTAAATDDIVEVRWTHINGGGHILLDEGQIFRLTTQDDLSGLTDFRWNLQGKIFDKGVFTDKIPRLTLGTY